MITRSKAKLLAEEQKSGHKIQIDRPLERSGMIEDRMFSEAILFRNDDDIILEGMNYFDIQRDANKMEELIKLRNNLPHYYSLNNRQKNKFFQDLGHQYFTKLDTFPINKVENAINKQSKMDCYEFGNSFVDKFEIPVFSKQNKQQESKLRQKRVSFHSHENFKEYSTRSKHPNKLDSIVKCSIQSETDNIESLIHSLQQKNQQNQLFSVHSLLR